MDIEHRDHWLPESCQHLKAFWSVNKAKVMVICMSFIDSLSQSLWLRHTFLKTNISLPKEKTIVDDFLFPQMGFLLVPWKE